MSRFDYVQWDDKSESICTHLKSLCMPLEKAIEQLLEPSRERSCAITALEECFMWIGKAIRHDQMERERKGEDGTLPLPKFELGPVGVGTLDPDINPTGLPPLYVQEVDRELGKICVGTRPAFEFKPGINFKDGLGQVPVNTDGNVWIPNGWEVCGEPRRIGALMFVEIREKK